jgi:hypothetical protein
MDKPMIKKKISIQDFDLGTRVIEFWTDPETAKRFECLGQLITMFAPRYKLVVDMQIDFCKVLQWMRDQEYDL